jgi:hypothetical protein
MYEAVVARKSSDGMDDGQEIKRMRGELTMTGARVY